MTQAIIIIHHNKEKETITGKKYNQENQKWIKQECHSWEVFPFRRNHDNHHDWQYIPATYC